MEACRQKVSRELASLTAVESNDSGSFSRQATWRTYWNRLQAKIFFFFQAQLNCCHTLFLQEKQHSITIFKSNTPWLHCSSSTEGKPFDKGTWLKSGRSLLHWRQRKQHKQNHTKLHFTQLNQRSNRPDLASLIMHSTQKIKVRSESHHLSWKL